MRRAAKKDANHVDIVDALRKAGCKVLDLGAVGNGCPDLMAYRHPFTRLLEVKDGSKPPSARKLTPDQVKFHREWEGNVFIVTSVDEALATMGVS